MKRFIDILRRSEKISLVAMKNNIIFWLLIRLLQKKCRAESAWFLINEGILNYPKFL